MLLTFITQSVSLGIDINTGPIYEVLPLDKLCDPLCSSSTASESASEEEPRRAASRSSR